MDRRAHAHFHVIRLRRWSLALLFFAALALLAIPRLTSQVPENADRITEPAGGDPSGSTDSSVTRVEQGVTLLNRDFSGMTEADARAVLAEMATTYRQSPASAYEGRAANGTRFVVPEVNGYQLDIETTWFRLASAAGGARVEPATTAIPPEKRLSDFPQGVVTRGNPNKKAVGLLINVDWGEKELQEMLPMFKRRGVKATFFVSGRFAEKNKNLLKLIAQDGHEIGSHGYDLSTGPSDLVQAGKLKEDIARSAQIIEGITGGKVLYYAPHKSEVSPEIVDAAASLNLRTVLYSVDTIDWRDGPDLILSRIQKAKAGDLILMHPKPNTLKVLDQGLASLQSSGLTAITLSEMLSPNPQTSSNSQSP